MVLLRIFQLQKSHRQHTLNAIRINGLDFNIINVLLGWGVDVKPQVEISLEDEFLRVNGSEGEVELITFWNCKREGRKKSFQVLQNMLADCRLQPLAS